MSKDMNVTIWPLWDNGFGEMYADVGKRWPENVDFMVYAKRLTDTELAAEVQSAVFHEAECEVRGLRLAQSEPECPGIDHWVKWNHEFGRRAGILERFAKLPHHDDQP